METALSTYKNTTCHILLSFILTWSYIIINQINAFTFNFNLTNDTIFYNTHFLVLVSIVIIEFVVTENLTAWKIHPRENKNSGRKKHSNLFSFPKPNIFELKYNVDMLPKLSDYFLVWCFGFHVNIFGSKNVRKQNRFSQTKETLQMLGNSFQIKIIFVIKNIWIIIKKIISWYCSWHFEMECQQSHFYYCETFWAMCSYVQTFALLASYRMTNCWVNCANTLQIVVLVNTMIV